MNIHAQLALIDLPANFTSEVASTTGSLISDFSSPIYLVLGVLLLGTLVSILVRSMARH